MNAVWIVDDDQSIRWVLEKALAKAGMTARSFASGDELLESLEEDPPSVLVTDIRMPGINGLDLLRRVKERVPELPVIVMTAFTDLESTVEAFQKGAFEFLPKPFDVPAAVALIERAAQRDTTASCETAQAPAKVSQGRSMMQSSSPAMQEVFRAIGRLASSHVTVLITGESGSGKELIARALHQHGSRSQGPFVALNAAAIPKDLLEAELFGHERGAFTGATQLRRGRFEEAGGGTLFLDEIGDMPFDLQTRLLRVLAEGTFYRVGGSQAIRADVRIIAATHQPLEQRVEEGRFREDLFHRLNVIRLRLPPLRERREDIPALARLFLRNSAQDLGVEPRELSPEAMEALLAFDYPGNIRQLENFCQWLTVMSSSRWIEAKDLPPELQRGPSLILNSQDALTLETATEGQTDLASGGHDLGVAPAEGSPAPEPEWEKWLMKEALERLARKEPAVMTSLCRDFERVMISAGLSFSRGRRVEAAQRLGIGRNTLTRKCSELGLDDPNA